MGLDIGERRIGVATGDTATGIAMPACVMNAQDVLADSRTWRQLVQECEPELLVCGLPRTLSGQQGGQAAHVRELASKIAAAASLPLAFSDERLSSAEAKRYLRAQGCSERDMRGKVDSVAASLLLETWMRAKRNHEVEER